MIRSVGGGWLWLGGGDWDYYIMVCFIRLILFISLFCLRILFFFRFGLDFIILGSLIEFYRRSFFVFSESYIIYFFILYCGRVFNYFLEYFVGEVFSFIVFNFEIKEDGLMVEN